MMEAEGRVTAAGTEGGRGPEARECTQLADAGKGEERIPLCLHFSTVRPISGFCSPEL